MLYDEIYIERFSLMEFMGVLGVGGGVSIHTIIFTGTAPAIINS